jgi:UDP-glucose 4-epimerase
LSKKILITGGTGFIGYHLAKKCLQLKWKVTSISSKQPNKIRKLKKVNYIICDISNKKKLSKVLSLNFNYIVNLAGYVDHSDSIKTMKSHFVGCKNLALIFKNSKLDKFVQIGSCIEYGKKRSPQIDKNTNYQKTYSVYGEAKLKSTKFLINLYKKFNFPATILRLYLIYGSHQDPNRVIPLAIKKSICDEKFDCSKGTQLRDFLHVDDLVIAIIKCLKSDRSTGQIINLGSGKPVTIKNIIQKICKIIKFGKPQFGKIKYRKDEIMRLFPNIDKAKKLLNWSPKINITSGLKKTISFYKKLYG